MPRGSSPKREREYREIEQKFEKEGRYKGREEEVAARIVNKQRRKAGETQSARGGSKSERRSSRTRRAKRSARSSGSKRVSQRASGRTTARKPSSSSRSRRSNGARRLTEYTTDHDTIRRWAEARGAKPSAVVRTERKGDPGIIRLDFPGYSGEGSLEEISWDAWFEKFDESGLQLAYQERTASGERSNFNKLVKRDARGRGGSRAGSSRKRASSRSRSDDGRSGSRRSSRTGRTASARKASSRRSSNERSEHLTHYTVDHDEIRQWAEARGGEPAAVMRTARSKKDPGIIRIDFPGYSGEGTLKKISWSDWFKKFDESGLALAYQDHTRRGQRSNFNKLISRDHATLQ